MKESKPERLLARKLQSRKIKFKKQYKINGHRADFLVGKDLVVEVDGKLWHNYPFGTWKDQQQTANMRAYGFRVIRFWDSEILKDVDRVVNEIEMIINPPDLIPF